MKILAFYFRATVAIRQMIKVCKFRWLFIKRAISNYWKLWFGALAFLGLGVFIYLIAWRGNDPIFKVGETETWQNIVSELHGLWFDVLLFGVVLVIFEKIRDKKEVITRYLEELDDYRGWDSAEAYQRTYGILRRLINERFYRIDMRDIFMKNQKIYKPLNFEYSMFQRACLENSEFYLTFFIAPSFFDTNFTRTRFDNCNFISPTFSTPIFQATIFRNCEFSNASFHGLKIFQELRPSVYFEDCKFITTDFKNFNVLSITGLNNCSFEACEAYEFQKTKLEDLGVQNGVFYLQNPVNHLDRANAEEHILDF